MTDSQLIEFAREARHRAYAPYSHYPVGAALLTTTGEVFTGCNIENASYSLTQCAERVALGNAITHGARTFDKLALCLEGDGSPCGACRQALNEFAPNLTILMTGPSGDSYRKVSLAELLPAAFGPKNLEQMKEARPLDH